MDLFPTLARIAGGKVPTDRVIDGVDQSDFFFGKQQMSNRDSVVIYVGNDLHAPGCTPSRAALMTGRYSQRAGLSSIIVGGTPNTLQASAVTLGELFKSRGYATGYTGKWHLGASEIS